METKHTPGPWINKRHDYIDWDITGPTVDVRSGHTTCRIVARIASWSGKDDEAIANANLITAAPDMLAALRGIITVADRKTNEFDAARAAVAKATGEAVQS